MKLKTLKDIDKEIGELINSNEKGKLRLDLHHLNNLIREKVKQEAIKHISKLIKRFNELDKIRPKKTENVIEMYKISGKIGWIKHFFNITEEDLR